MPKRIFRNDWRKRVTLEQSNMGFASVLGTSEMPGNVLALLLATIRHLKESEATVTSISNCCNTAIMRSSSSPCSEGEATSAVGMPTCANPPHTTD